MNTVRFLVCYTMDMGVGDDGGGVCKLFSAGDGFCLLGQVWVLCCIPIYMYPGMLMLGMYVRRIMYTRWR